MKKNIPLLTFIFILCTLQCSKNNKPVRIKPNFITLKSLTAINLSEDMNEVSTQEDEILLFVCSVKKLESSHHIITEWSNTFLFKSRNETATLSDNIPIINSALDADKLLFFLVELDNENSELQVRNILKENIKQSSSFKNLDKSQWDKKLGHDDFLGMQLLDLKKRYTPTEDILEFKGLQLFDRYEYHLKIQF